MKKVCFLSLSLVLAGCAVHNYLGPNPAGPGHHPGIGVSFFSMDSAVRTIGTVWQAGYRYGFNDYVDVGMDVNFFTRKPDTSSDARATSWTFFPTVRYATPRFGALRSSFYLGAGYTFGTLYRFGGSSEDTASYVIHLMAGASPGVVMGPVTAYIPLRYTYSVPPDIEDVNWVGMFSGGLGCEARVANRPVNFEALFDYIGEDEDTGDLIATLSWGFHFAW